MSNDYVEEDDDNSDYYVFSGKSESLVGVAVDGEVYTGVDKINEELQNRDLWVGYNYTFLYEFSEQIPAQYEDGKKVAMQYARYILRSLKLSFSNTSNFTFRVLPTGRQPIETDFEGFVLDDMNLGVMDRINLATGTYKFPINNRSDSVRIQIVSTFPFPCNFHTCEFQGTLINKSGRF